MDVYPVQKRAGYSFFDFFLLIEIELAPSFSGSLQE
jgi:hypothetical protein